MSFLEAQLQSRKREKDVKDMIETHKRPQKVFFVNSHTLKKFSNIAMHCLPLDS
jgi:hypothetical protein